MASWWNGRHKGLKILAHLGVAGSSPAEATKLVIKLGKLYMIRFVTLGTNDLKKSSNFYDEILKIIDINRVDEENEGYVGYAKEKK